MIEVGSSSKQNLANRYADDQLHSFMMENFSFSDVPRISHIVKNWCFELTGERPSPWKEYDMEVTADSAHKNSKYSSYLWIDSNGTLMETPMVYENDKVEIGYRHASFGVNSPLCLIFRSTAPLLHRIYIKKCLHRF